MSSSPHYSFFTVRGGLGSLAGFLFLGFTYLFLHIYKKGEHILLDNLAILKFCVNITSMIKRILEHKIVDGLHLNPAVAILGPRQVGKTTLALKIAKSHKKSIYLDLESPQDLAKLQDPVAYLSANQDKLIILDEIQRVPDLFPVLRGLIDKRRQEGQKGGHFLILGSSSVELIKQSSESLAGRIRYFELGGLSALELKEAGFSHLNEPWLRGGFPESVLTQSDETSALWREDFIRTYLERDVAQLGPRVPATTLRRLWTMLAHSQGTTINVANLSSGLDVSNVTTNRYIDLLCDLLLVRKIQPWAKNTKKRLVKTPMTYVRDSGLVHQLLNITTYDALLSHPIVGKSWEGFVIENLISVLPELAAYSYYRTSAGAEIDLIIELPNQEIWAIEIKKTSSPKVERGFYNACEDVQPTKSFVVYGGEEEYPLPNGVKAISLIDMMKQLQDFEN